MNESVRFIHPQQGNGTAHLDTVVNVRVWCIIVRPLNQKAQAQPGVAKRERKVEIAYARDAEFKTRLE